ncbi:hypothetical protein GCM10023313_34330 [Mucilaginibacter defluvii]|uniref:Uncharacterized protein n=2 Tax=Mucilaginibacter defluvii TaxID=1196019 RepID=A0ABP9G3S1_9SPHI
MAYQSVQQTLLNKRLRSENNKIRAVVTNRYKVGAKGATELNYTFKLNGKFYKGHAYNESANVGDSLDILYLSDNPNLNKSYKCIHEK